VRDLTLVASATGLVVLLLVIFKLRQRPIVEARVPGEDWQRTDELVHDPTTGRMLRIWVDPADGSRYTVAELR
jgi:hypothetical protein